MRRLGAETSLGRRAVQAERFQASGFLKMAETCCFTVPSVMFISPAICLFNSRLRRPGALILRL